MPEFLLALISTVLAGLLLDLILNKSSVTKKIFLRIFENLKSTSHDKLLIYLSVGGTCRDPMAKAITGDTSPPKDESLSAGHPWETSSTMGVREAG